MNRLKLLLVLTLQLFILGCLSNHVSQNPTDDTSLVLVGATIYPAVNEKPIDDGVVVIDKGKIIAVGAKNAFPLAESAVVLNCKGMFIVAGFQNSHAHFTEVKWHDIASQSNERLSLQLEDMFLRYGFTTVVDTGSYLTNTLLLRKRINNGAVNGPRILTAGTPLYPENGIPFYLRELMPAALLAQLYTPKTPEEASMIVASQLDNGADVVKLFTGSWVERGRVLPMAGDIAKAAVTEAHRRGKLVFSHASSIAGLEVALDAGVDVLAHALDDDRGWNESHVERMKAGRMTMVPTLKLFGGKPYTKYIQQLVSDYASGGGEIMFGTDVGYLTDYDPAEEYVLMAGAGFNWRQILGSLTETPAKRFGEASRRGKITSGMDADIVVLDGDPSNDLNAFTRVHYTILGGRIVYGK